MLIFDWITDAIKMQDFGQVWVIHPILELKLESVSLEAHRLKVEEIRIQLLEKRYKEYTRHNNECF